LLSPVNLYFKRSPSVEPGDECPNPAAQTLVECDLYRGDVFPGDLINYGQGLGPVDANGKRFEVIFRGSNRNKLFYIHRELE
jgi:hypothetical protein